MSLFFSRMVVKKHTPLSQRGLPMIEATIPRIGILRMSKPVGVVIMIVAIEARIGVMTEATIEGRVGVEILPREDPRVPLLDIETDLKASTNILRAWGIYTIMKDPKAKIDVLEVGGIGISTKDPKAKVDDLKVEVTTPVPAPL